MRTGMLLFLSIFSVIWAGCTSLTNNASPKSTEATKSENSINNQQDEEDSEKKQSVVAYEAHDIVTDLRVPWSIVLLDDGKMYVGERNGQIYKIDKEGNKILYFTVPNVWSKDEAGLMGIVLDPDYETNHYLYLSVARDQKLQIIRYTDTGQSFASETILVDMLPVAKYHAGGALAFGPDKKLYFSVGDATERQKAQDLNSFHGKILRINSDGSIPDDNPFSGSAIWSLGHRNVQGIDWTSSGIMIASEHGPSGFDGAPGGDEINKIVPGGNYGWPIVSHKQHRDGLIDPLITYTPALAPSGLIVYQGNLFPQRKDKIIVAGLGGKRLVVIDPQNGKEQETLFDNTHGRLRALAQNSEGEIFVSTSNTDGRGTAQPGDDRIFKIQEL